MARYSKELADFHDLLPKITISINECDRLENDCHNEFEHFHAFSDYEIPIVAGIKWKTFHFVERQYFLSVTHWIHLFHHNFSACLFFSLPNEMSGASARSPSSICSICCHLLCSLSSSGEFIAHVLITIHIEIRETEKKPPKLINLSRRIKFSMGLYWCASATAGWITVMLTFII